MEVLKRIYYDPESGLQGARSLYKKAIQIDKTITQKFVDAWLKKQETQQVHAAPKVIKHYFPIKADEQDHIWQIDLMDVSSQAHNNAGINYLMCVVDIWSRFAWVRPLKNKTNKICTDAFREILEEGRVPQIVMSDNGSEFISHSWRKLLKDYGIRSSYAEPGDHHRQGIVERFNKTIRGMLTKYMTAYKTNRYIDMIPKLVKNYNTTVHSSTGSTPSKPNGEKIEAFVKDKEDKAREDLTYFKVGDHVRTLKNKVMFEKGATPKYSQTVHTVLGFLASKRYLLDNGKAYLYYHLQPVDEQLDKFEPPTHDEHDERDGVALDVALDAVLIPKRERIAHKKEGIERRNIREGLRERKPAVDLVTKKGEKVNW